VPDPSKVAPGGRAAPAGPSRGQARPHLREEGLVARQVQLLLRDLGQEAVLLRQERAKARVLCQGMRASTGPRLNTERRCSPRCAAGGPRAARQWPGAGCCPRAAPDGPAGSGPVAGRCAAPSQGPAPAHRRHGRGAPPAPAATGRRGEAGMGAAACQGMGVRQPSRPLNSGQKARRRDRAPLPGRARPRAGPAPRPGRGTPLPRSERSSASSTLAKASGVRPGHPAQRVITRGTSWLLKAQQVHPVPMHCSLVGQRALQEAGAEALAQEGEAVALVQEILPLSIGPPDRAMPLSSPDLAKGDGAGVAVQEGPHAAQEAQVLRLRLVMDVALHAIGLDLVARSRTTPPAGAEDCRGRACRAGSS